MSAKLFLNQSIKFIPQDDFAMEMSDNEGISAKMSFLARSADLGVGSNLNLFTRGTRLEQLFPECSPLYRNLTLATFPHSDHSPGIISINCTFTGPKFSTNGSSGDDQVTPTSSFRGNLEEAPLSESPAWKALGLDEQVWLGELLNGTMVLYKDGATPGIWDEKHELFFPAKDGDDNAVTFTGDALIFAKMISGGKTTCKRPSWNYNYRVEGKTGFTSAQLGSLGKIVASPPGNPPKPGSGWTWMLVGPDQSQNGPDRFIKDLSFQLIPDNDENQLLYGS